MSPSDFHPEPLLDIVEACRAADGVAPLNEAMLLRLEATGIQGMTLVMDAENTGFALVSDDGALNLGVHPAARGAGRATALLGAALDLAGDRELTVWAHGDLPGARSLAARFGFTPQRELWRMECPAPQKPLPAAVPPGVRIRPFRVGVDEPAFLRVNAIAFADHPEQGRLDRAGLEQRMEQAWFDAEGFLVAERGGDLVGFHWTKFPADQPDLGEVYVIAVAPEERGTGLARALLAAGLAHLAAKGADRVQLYVEADNAPAVAIYKKSGFRHLGTDVQFSQKII